MKTKRITLYYKVTQKEVIEPDAQAMRRKNEWIKEVQGSVEADWKPLSVKVTYEIFNPEVEQQRKFFNGPVIKYYVIQNEDMVVGTPDSTLLKKYRETLLDELLGYNVELVGDKTARRRHSTADFTSTQKWHDFLEMARETLFEPNGYDFPDSKTFWEIAKKVGYVKAEAMAIQQLQKKIKLSTQSPE